MTCIGSSSGLLSVNIKNRWLRRIYVICEIFLLHYPKSVKKAEKKSFDEFLFYLFTEVQKPTDLAAKIVL
jgi:hypothetical protein